LDVDHGAWENPAQVATTIGQIESAEHAASLEAGREPVSRRLSSGGPTVMVVDGPPQVIPIFPLDLVLMPGAPQELHLFEPRYRQMLVDAEESARTQGADRRACFGIVSLRRGTETGLEQTVAEVGTLGEVVQMQRYADGTSDLLLIGTRRFRIETIDTEQAYLQAHVEWLEEDDGAEPDELAELDTIARSLFRNYGVGIQSLTGRVEDALSATDAISLSYEISYRIRLAAPDAARRLRSCLSLLNREITLLHKTRSVPISAKALQIVPVPN
jgi:Lon protease-like protein